MLKQVSNVFSDFSDFVSNLDVNVIQDEQHLRQVMRQTRTLQRVIEGLTLKIHARADALAGDGESASGFEIALDIGQVSGAKARLESKRAQTIAAVPGLFEAVVAGETSGEHLDSVGRHINKLSEDERNKIDSAEISDAAAAMPADTFNRHMKRVVDKIRDDHGLKDAEEKRKASEFKHWFDKNTGMGKFCGQLDPVRYEALTNVIDQQTSRLAVSASGNNISGARLSKDSNLAAAALYSLVTGCDVENSGSVKQRLPHITVIVDQKTLETGFHNNSIHQTSLGTELPPETVERLCCDSVLQKVVHDDKNIPINVGRKYRTATDAQWTAINSIYDSCGWKNCDRRLIWCQIHHIKEWENNGPTNLNNLVPLC